MMSKKYGTTQNSQKAGEKKSKFEVKNHPMGGFFYC